MLDRLKRLEFRCWFQKPYISNCRVKSQRIRDKSVKGRDQPTNTRDKFPCSRDKSVNPRPTWSQDEASYRKGQVQPGLMGGGRRGQDTRRRKGALTVGDKPSQVHFYWILQKYCCNFILYPFIINATVTFNKFFTWYELLWKSHLSRPSLDNLGEIIHFKRSGNIKQLNKPWKSFDHIKVFNNHVELLLVHLVGLTLEA